MSRKSLGTINPSTEDGTALASDLSDFGAAWETLHKGSGRPAYAVAGLPYIDDSATPWNLFVYDGSNDLLIGTIDATNHRFTPVAAWDGAISPSQLTANTDDWAPTGHEAAQVIRFSTDASRNITGLTAPSPARGKIKVLENIGSNDAVLKNASSSSSTANRFAFKSDITVKGGQALLVWYDTTSSRWRSANTALDDATATSLLPIGAISDFAGSSAPAGWLLCFGQNVSRTTYAALFAVISTTFGVGDGSTTFGIPDLRGRGTFGDDDMGGSAASRITNAGSGIVGTTLGASGGAQNVTLSTGNIPPLPVTGSGGALPATAAGSGWGNGGTVVGGQDASVQANAGVSAAAVNKMPPALIVTKMIYAGA